MDIRLPRLGEGAESGTVVTILVKVGGRINKDQTILELENEKAVAPIPSTASGTVTAIYVKTGDKVTVGQKLISLTEEGAGAAASSQETARQAQEPVPPKVPTATQRVETVPSLSVAGAENYAYTSKSGTPPPAAPSVRKIAKELGIDLTRIRGSERGGRIVLADLKAYIQQIEAMAAQKTASQTSAAQRIERPLPVSIDFSLWGPVTKKPVTSLRKAIGKQMALAWATVPRVTQFDEADITELINLKKKYDAAYEKKGAKLTLTSFALVAVVEFLKRYPVFNASLDEAAGELVYKEYHHIGIAVDTEQGLIVPVLRDVDKKSMLQLSKELQELAERTRQRKVTLEELKGGTFSISNQGGIGGAHFTPIVNVPEVAILGIGKGVLKPAVKGEKIEPRLILPLSLSYDHRVIDGGNAARFIRDLVQTFERFPEAQVKI